VAPANPESGHFSEIRIRPNSYPDWPMPVHLDYIELITGKINAADLSSGVFAVLISFNSTPMMSLYVCLYVCISVCASVSR